MLLEQANVSRETLACLEQFETMLVQWNKHINLVSKSAISELWRRHMADSLGLLPQNTVSGTWIDLGSGGGFPVVPLAIADRSAGGDRPFFAVESDQRKAAFLREVGRRLSLNLTVAPSRIEAADLPPAAIVSARALASTSELLALSQRFVAKNGACLFLKGDRLDRELTEASKEWHMVYQYRRHPITKMGHILRVERFDRISACRNV